MPNLKKVRATVAARAKKLSASSEQYLVAVDIGTEFVKAMIGRVEGEDIKIVGVGRAHQKLTDMQAGAIADIPGVVQNCNVALGKAEEQAGISVRTAIIGIAGELVKGTTTTVRCTRKDPTQELSVAEMEQIIALVQERAEAKARKTLAWELGGKEVEIRMVNSALVNITIDGYVVTNPIGFKGRDVVVQLYTAFAPMIHISALERAAQELDLDLLAVAAEPFAVARAVIGDNPNASMSAILMDVGGGTTDIAVVNEGGVQGTKMFGMALSEYTNLDNLPHEVLLCGGGSSLDMLLQTLKETNWYSELPFTRKPSIAHINPHQVVGIQDETGDITDHTFVTAMGLLRVGLDTVEQEDSKVRSGSIKSRFDRILRV
jgi:hypothetical protein